MLCFESPDTGDRETAMDLLLYALDTEDDPPAFEAAPPEPVTFEPERRAA